ncbi:hypothetical protein [Pseudoalteromonas rubra]|uniref:Gluconate 2-dehydrogenase subunit 3 family protein n=1 Tax=Pseudoalteromonas rubra TaxID=43658 RepID=A0A0U3HVF7_9GAMM|nr:hypothetical protein [Pseudoalteromonas rubra]ALU41574.1 hypothetical protein AT705_00750 [Pseudoalteromonas rubra]
MQRRSFLKLLALSSYPLSLKESYAFQTHLPSSKTKRILVNLIDTLIPEDGHPGAVQLNIPDKFQESLTRVERVKLTEFLSLLDTNYPQLFSKVSTTQVSLRNRVVEQMFRMNRLRYEHRLLRFILERSYDLYYTHPDINKLYLGQISPQPNGYRL